MLSAIFSEVGMDHEWKKKKKKKQFVSMIAHNYSVLRQISQGMVG